MRPTGLHRHGSASAGALTAVPRADLASWEAFAAASREGWLFHTSRWLVALGLPGPDLSFAVLAADGKTQALAVAVVDGTRATT